MAELRRSQEKFSNNNFRTEEGKNLYKVKNSQIQIVGSVIKERRADDWIKEV